MLGIEHFAYHGMDFERGGRQVISSLSTWERDQKPRNAIVSQHRVFPARRRARSRLSPGAAACTDDASAGAEAHRVQGARLRNRFRLQGVSATTLDLDDSGDRGRRSRARPSGRRRSERKDGRFHHGGANLRPGKYIGSVPVQAGIATGLYVAGRYFSAPAKDGSRTNKLSHLGFDLMRALIVSQTLTQAIKVTVRRDRPTGECCAFPSGHSSAAFATASVLERHLGYRAAWPTLLIATYVGASRLHDNRHFASDVVFGAALGIATGWTVVGRHGRTDNTRWCRCQPAQVSRCLWSGGSATSARIFSGESSASASCSLVRAALSSSVPLQDPLLEHGNFCNDVLVQNAHLTTGLVIASVDLSAQALDLLAHFLTKRGKFVAHLLYRGFERCHPGLEPISCGTRAMSCGPEVSRGLPFSSRETQPC